METGIRNFRKEGNRYVLKRQYGFTMIIVLGLTVMAWLGYHSDNKAMLWIFGILAALCLLSVFTERMVIDMDQKALFIKRGLIKPEVRIPFSDITNYQLSRLIYIFVPVNTSLNVEYICSDKMMFAIVAQGFSKRAMQSILNDIEEIISPYDDRKQV
ncbi:hypothetical protein MKJ01_11605 [Chryseobacterium sp. SSA4.19]|uniref:hypothetical protein n=1 Tax=Chryseobacterium sp. SSA4.19 TaxID=2919915 RepID=UPI001F4E6BEC|nr:hypothetical protein [Chryseobacterium sp. SSA4.19]MCJ8154407.1 hypothetical protein [Chryseobacterium sp. SSA4.19]